MDQFLMVSTIVVYVESRLQSGFEYDGLEKTTGYSLSYIRAVFSKLTGRSLSRYILSRRIANAAFEITNDKTNIFDIAAKYGFSNPDTFTRAFRRMTGYNPVVYRKQKKSVGRAVLCAGVYGVTCKPDNHDQHIMERIVPMNNKEQKHKSDGSVVLYGVPKVHYGAFGGVTPLPISMKAAANYIGEELDYTDAIVNCGMAFRLNWNEKYWDGGNVGDVLTFDDPFKVFRCAIESLGCKYNLLARTKATEKSEFISFIMEKINKGIPVIARGVVGPPEAGIISGYRENGHTLLGWSVFQSFPEFAGNISFDESGYYITDQWWKNEDTNAVMSLGDSSGNRFTIKTIVENAIEVMTPRRIGEHAKAGYAYDAWKKAILDETQFKNNMVGSLLTERLMCQGDAMDCLADGRSNAYKYFQRLADSNQEQPLFGSIAEQFAEAATCAHMMYEVLGGWERGEKQMQALATRDIRVKLGNLIDKCKAADGKAYGMLQELLQML